MATLKRYSSKTDKGPYLDLNEDGLEVDLKNNLYLIFDGFGGGNIGDKIVRLLRESIKNFYTKIGHDSDATLPFFYSPKYLIEGNALINAMYQAQDLVIKENENKDMGQKGGASGIGAALSESILTLAGVGNCAAYLYRKGELEMVFYPDSLRDYSFDFFHSPHQTSPLSGFGLFKQLHLQVREIRILDQDLIILLTDGIYGRITTPEIQYLVKNEGKNLQEKLSKLINLANSRGNLDNQTGLLLQF